MKGKKKILKNKRAENKIIGGIIFFVFAVALLVAFFPVFANLEQTADESIEDCLDGSYPDLNDSYIPSICCVSPQNCTSGNTTIDYVGLNPVEETLLGLTVMFIVLGLIAFAAIKFGLKRT